MSDPVIDELKKQVETLQQEFSRFGQVPSSVEFQTLNKNIETANNGLKETNNRVQENENKLNKIEPDISNLQAAVNSIRSSLDTTLVGLTIGGLKDKVLHLAAEAAVHVSDNNLLKNRLVPVMATYDTADALNFASIAVSIDSEKGDFIADIVIDALIAAKNFTIERDALFWEQAKIDNAYGETDVKALIDQRPRIETVHKLLTLIDGNLNQFGTYFRPLASTTVHDFGRNLFDSLFQDFSISNFGSDGMLISDGNKVIVEPNVDDHHLNDPMGFQICPPILLLISQLPTNLIFDSLKPEPGQAPNIFNLREGEWQPVHNKDDLKTSQKIHDRYAIILNPTTPFDAEFTIEAESQFDVISNVANVSAPYKFLDTLSVGPVNLSVAHGTTFSDIAAQLFGVRKAGGYALDKGNNTSTDAIFSSIQGDADHLPFVYQFISKSVDTGHKIKAPHDIVVAMTTTPTQIAMQQESPAPKSEFWDGQKWVENTGNLAQAIKPGPRHLFFIRFNIKDQEILSGFSITANNPFYAGFYTIQ